MGQELTASEAAARLGVKRATLYAYVSRGLLHRHMAMDGRTSLFDAGEIDGFRSDRRRSSEGEVDAVISTGLTRVSDGEVRIRGRDLIEMVENGEHYESIVDWLFASTGEPWHLPAEIAERVQLVQAAMPTATPLIDRLRVTNSVVSAMDPLRFDPSEAGVSAAARVLLIAMATGLPAVGKPATAQGSIAELLWSRLSPRRALTDRRAAVDAALGLLVDHGLAASTFAARVAASVRADPYSTVAAGLGVVGGTLHGAASGSVHDLFVECERMGDPVGAVAELQRQGRLIPGFGHTVYRSEDPRYVALMQLVSEAWRTDERLSTVHAVRDLVSRRTEAIPNVDLALGALTWLADMAPDAGEAIFAIARTAGWVAHGIEEFGEPALRFGPVLGTRVTGVKGGQRNREPRGSVKDVSLDPAFRGNQVRAVRR